MVIKSVVGQVRRVSAGAIAFPCKQLATGARAPRLFTSPKYILHCKIRYYHTLSCPATLRFADGRGFCLRLLEVGSRGLIIKYSLNDGVAASKFI